MRPIAAGEPITTTRLSGEGGRASVAALLNPDMRAASIRISDVAGVAGFVLPGDRVDVIMTREAPSGQLADVLLHNVRVLAIDQVANENREEMTAGDAGALKTATLEVSQQDAQKLALGSSVGTLSLILRSPRSMRPEAVAFAMPVSERQLAGGAGRIVPAASPSVPAARPAPSAPRVRKVPTPSPRPSGPIIEVVRGTTPQQYQVVPYAGS
jgi:pilus assembly protein CpaB